MTTATVLVLVFIAFCLGLAIGWPVKRATPACPAKPVPEAKEPKPDSRIDLYFARGPIVEARYVLHTEGRHVVFGGETHGRTLLRTEPNPDLQLGDKKTIRGDVYRIHKIENEHRLEYVDRPTQMVWLELVSKEFYPY